MLHPKCRGDEVSDDAVYQRTGPDMDDGLAIRFIASDEPGAQTADEPDDGEGSAGMIFPIPEEQGEHHQQGDGIRDQMSEIGMEQWTKDDPDKSVRCARQYAKA